MCRLSVDHRSFPRIDVGESFKRRTEYRILKYERVKKYPFNESTLQRAGSSHIICGKRYHLPKEGIRKG